MITCIPVKCGFITHTNVSGNIIEANYFMYLESIQNVSDSWENAIPVVSLQNKMEANTCNYKTGNLILSFGSLLCFEDFLLMSPLASQGMLLDLWNQ